MTRCFSIVLLLLLGKTTTAQYTGGSNDGISSTAVSNQNPLPSIYLGGSNDGISSASVSNQNPLPSIYFGGSNDGISSASVSNQNPLPSIYLGGSSDGFSFSFAVNQNCTGDSAKWNGSISTAWENPANWSCGVLPTIGSNVIIPSGLARYPVVSFMYEIRSLLLQPGSSVTIQPGVLFKLNNQ
jgi:hypothetical protein